MRNTLERLTEHITVVPDGCWLWTGRMSPKGYAQPQVDGKGVHAHRLVYEMVYGEIPAGMVIDHLCGVRHCLNPRHLEAVTNQQNVWRGIALVNNETCKSGRHVLAVVGIVTDLHGADRCRECRRESKARYRQKKAA